jgi:hypothetical protein
MRWMLFFDGRNAKRAWPVVQEYIRPNVKPKKPNSPSGTLQICVLSWILFACRGRPQVFEIIRTARSIRRLTPIV